VVLLDDHAARHDLRIRQDLVDPLDLGARHLDRIERCKTRGHRRLRFRPGADDRQELRAMSVAAFGRVEPRIAGERIAADQAREALPGVVDLRSDDEVAVRAPRIRGTA